MRQSIAGSMQSTRKKIFDRYDPKHDESNIRRDYKNKRQKNRESLRAQDLLQKSLFLLVNIQGFQTSKNKYKTLQLTFQNYLQSQTDKLQRQNLSKTGYKSTDYEQTLEQYYQYLRRNRQLLQSMECLSLANLSNFNASHTKMQFTRDYQTADQDLKRWIQILKQQRLSLQQSLVVYEYQLPESQILGQTESFEYSLQELSRTMKEENIIKVHYLMMYQLQDLDRMIKRQRRLINQAEQSYYKHEAINDSLRLMVTHRQQMVKDEESILRRGFRGLNVDNAPDIVPKGSGNSQILDKNLKIYQSNLQNYVRIGAQTNMSQFQDRRHAYAAQLNNYEKSFTLWRKAQEKANYLYQRQHRLKLFKQKAILGDKRNLTQVQKESVLSAYYECLQYDVPKSLPDIKAYKYGLCGEMQNVITQNGIPLSQRQDVYGGRNDDVLRNYIQFFTALEYKCSKQKISYLMQRKDLISILKFELEQEESKGSNYETKKYLTALTYAETIVLCQEKIKIKGQYHVGEDIQRFREQFDSLRKQRWKGLPVGFEEVLFNYINDLRIYHESKEYFNRFQSVMRTFSDRMKQQLYDTLDQRIYVDTNQTPYYCVDVIDHGLVQSYFKEILRNVSRQNHDLHNLLLRNYWIQPEMTIRSVYLKHFKAFKDFSFATVQKKEFFTFKILCYMLLSGKNLKVPNIDDMCLYYLQFTARHYYQWNHNRKYLEIIKISMFKEYLQTVLSKYIDTRTLVQLFQNLYRFSVKMYECDLFLTMAKNTQQDIAYGLKIYRDLAEYTVKYSSTEKMQLQQKLNTLIKNIKKLPIVIGTKRIHDSFNELFSLSDVVRQLRIARSDRPDYFSEFLSRVYVSNEKLTQIQKAMQNSYDSYENVSVKDKKQIIYYLAQVDRDGKEIMHSIAPKIIEIKKIFKDREDRQDRRVHNQGQKSEISQLINGIIDLIKEYDRAIV